MIYDRGCSAGDFCYFDFDGGKKCTNIHIKCTLWFMLFDRVQFVFVAVNAPRLVNVGFCRKIDVFVDKRRKLGKSS